MNTNIYKSAHLDNGLEESKAKTGPSGTTACSWPVSIKSANLPPAFCMHSSTHTLTDRPRLCSVSAELWWPLWGSHAGGDVPGTLFHHDMLASLFLHSGGGFGVTPPLCMENEIKLYEPISSETQMRYIFLGNYGGEFESYTRLYVTEKPSLRPLLGWMSFLPPAMFWVYRLQPGFGGC